MQAKRSTSLRQQIPRWRFLQNQDVTCLGGLSREPGLYFRPLLLAQVAGISGKEA